MPSGTQVQFFGLGALVALAVVLATESFGSRGGGYALLVFLGLVAIGYGSVTKSQ